jgi:hypothetical protein
MNACGSAGKRTLRATTIPRLASTAGDRESGIPIAPSRIVIGPEYSFIYIEYCPLCGVEEGDHWYVAAIFTDDRVHHRWHRTRLELGANLVEENRQGSTVYYACGVFKERSGGRKAKNSAGAQALWTDIDAGEDKQYATAVDAHDALIQFCDAVGIPKPLFVCSGFGVHAYWPLADILDPETWKRYAGALANLLRQHGIKNERTTDLASILRPPGTYNRKHATPAPVTIIMVVFNDPVPVENPALQAVLMALEVREALGLLTATWSRLGHDIGFGIGIAHGFATLGTIGFEGRFDYAAIGTVSNVASRLCDETQPGQILISPRVLMKVENAVKVEPVGEFELKGIRRPLAAYNVVAGLSSQT